MGLSLSARASADYQSARREAYESSTEQRAQIAHQIGDEARAEAPVLTSAYRDGVSVEVDGSDVMIVDNDPDAFYKEYGTSKTPAHATLTNAASRHGAYTGFSPR